MRTILAAIDFSSATDPVVARATSLARDLDAELLLIHVAAPDPDFVGFESGPRGVRDSRAAELRDEHRRIQALTEGIRQTGLDALGLLVQGPTVATILDEAKRTEAEMVVVGSHSHGALFRALLGSTSEGLIRAGQTPVLVVPAAREAADRAASEEAM
jgi:nucleotide-binding universal stress UspA family protein